MNNFIEGIANVEGHIVVKCFYNPEDTWNGWAKPVFDIDTAKKLAEHFSTSDDMTIVRNENGFDTTYVEDDERCQENDITILVNDKEVVVNYVADGICWDAQPIENKDIVLSNTTDSSFICV